MAAKLLYKGWEEEFGWVKFRMRYYLHENIALYEQVFGIRACNDVTEIARTRVTRDVKEK